MPFFRKKPVTIEAVRFEDDPDVICDLSDLAGREITVDYGEPAKPVLRIDTLEGTMTAQVGDWIIKGVKGELYPCKPDIFAVTYEYDNA